MEVKEKEDECEKQLRASTGANEREFHQKNLRLDLGAWRRKIKPLYEILGVKLEDVTGVGKIVLDSHSASPNDYNNVSSSDPQLLQKCEDLYNDLEKKVFGQKADAAKIWGEVQNWWTELENNEELGACFTNGEAGILKSLYELKEQYEMRKRDKSRKLFELISDIRVEISSIWDQCKISEEEKRQFKEFESCEFTEIMLKIHKEELQKWRLYHAKSHEILLKLEKRETMWTTLRELEARAADPSRFVNRGGSLLKDQNMHKYLMKQLPKFENEIIALSLKFEVDHGRKIMVLGRDIPTIVGKDWEMLKEGKSSKSKGAKGGRVVSSPVKPALQSLRRSIAPGSSSATKRIGFGSSLDIHGGPAEKRAKTVLKMIQDEN